MDLTTNSESSLITPKKYCEYFSTMTPLAARFYEDVKKAEEKCKDFSSLSYDEKCSVIDKSFGISNSELPQTSALLLTVYPKKSDKYVYDENGWMDGHLTSFTACTESQLSSPSCKLATFVRNMKFPSIKQKSSVNKKGKAPVPFQSYADMHKGEERHEKSQAIPNFSPKYCNKADASAEDLRPNQKQNSDLIAELQAKLKRGNSSSETTKNPRTRAPPPPSIQKNSPHSTEIKLTASPKASLCCEDEFVVDVSSPCRIATPKTGFDFLDNW